MARNYRARPRHTTPRRGRGKETPMVIDHCESDKFCRACGQPNQPAPTGFFDGETGEAIYAMRCHNPTCHRGCENTGGHHLPTGFLSAFKAEICSRCGYEVFDLD